MELSVVSQRPILVFKR